MECVAKLIGIACVAVPLAAPADTPLRPPEIHRVCNLNVTFCAELDPSSDAIVYRVGAKFSATEEYRIPSWHRSAFLSPDGMYFASGYSGLNLLNLDDATESTVVLRLWKHGQPHMNVTLGQVLQSMSSLKRTVSHFAWGRNMGFWLDGRFEIETIEGRRVFVDPTAKTVKIDG